MSLSDIPLSEADQQQVQEAQAYTDAGLVEFSIQWGSKGTDGNLPSEGIFCRDARAMIETVEQEGGTKEDLLWEAGAYFFTAGIIFALHRQGAPIGWAGFPDDETFDPEIMVFNTHPGLAGKN